MEHRLHTHLDNIRLRLIEMGARVEAMIANATRAVVERDEALVSQVIEQDADVDRMEVEIDDDCHSVLARNQPTAIDMRFLVAAMKITADLERMADSAVNIGQAARQLNREPPLQSYVDLPRMSARVQAMVRESLDAFVSRDSALAASVVKEDDEVDQIYRRLFAELVDLCAPTPTTRRARCTCCWWRATSSASPTTPPTSPRTSSTTSRGATSGTPPARARPADHPPAAAISKPRTFGGFTMRHPRLQVSMLLLAALAAGCNREPIAAGGNEASANPAQDGGSGGSGGRDYMRIVGSSTVYPFATAVAERFARSGNKAPVIESTGTGGGLKLFCAGTGIDTPDVANASRRIKASEVELCRGNGVDAIVEVPIGYDGIVVANVKTAPRFNLTRRQLFLALAKQVPGDDGQLATTPTSAGGRSTPACPTRRSRCSARPPPRAPATPSSSW